MRFSAVFERAHGGDLQGVDYSRVKVDGGRHGAAGESSASRAIRTLRCIEQLIGPRGYEILEGIAGRRLTIGAVAKPIAAREGRSEKITGDYVSMRFAEACDDLERAWIKPKDLQ